MTFALRSMAASPLSTLSTLSSMLLLAFLLAAPAPACAGSARRIVSGVVTHVVDGDTLWVRTATAAKPVKVRIMGIDAPEICQAGGRASREALVRRLLGRSVTLSTSSSGIHDDYGRLLARIDLRGEDVGHWMVVNGHAWSYAYRRNLGPYAAEQSQAEAGRRGFFGESGAENPRSFRKRHGSCYDKSSTRLLSYKTSGTF